MYLFSVVLAWSLCYCASGQLLRPSELSCIYSMNSANIRSHERSRDKYYECDRNGVYNEKDCEAGHVFNEDSSLCELDLLRLHFADHLEEENADVNQTWYNKVCKTRGDGSRVPNYSDRCLSYFVCSHGKAAETFCAAGLLYNPQGEFCDWPQNVQCRCLGEDCPLVDATDIPSDIINEDSGVQRPTPPTATDETVTVDTEKPPSPPTVPGAPGAEQPTRPQRPTPPTTTLDSTASTPSESSTANPPTPPTRPRPTRTESTSTTPLPSSTIIVTTTTISRPVNPHEACLDGIPEGHWPSHPETSTQPPTTRVTYPTENDGHTASITSSWDTTTPSTCPACPTCAPATCPPVPTCPPVVTCAPPVTSTTDSESIPSTEGLPDEPSTDNPATDIPAETTVPSDIGGSIPSRPPRPERPTRPPTESQPSVPGALPTPRPPIPTPPNPDSD